MESSTFSYDINSFTSGIQSDRKTLRIDALNDLNASLFDSERIWMQEEIVEIWKEVEKPLTKCLTDPVEYCRYLSVELWKKFLNIVPVINENIVWLMPILWRRLSFLEQQETSEEVRLNCVYLLRLVIDKYKIHLPAYCEDFVAIFARTVTDSYPEIKRESCACIEKLASSIPVQFYPISESLVKPILANFNHQHYKVRAASVKAIGQVLLHGNSKAMEEISTPMAQRLFDQSGAVRLAVVEVAGRWFLELNDRYSWWHKLIPLLVTGLHDEIKDIRIRAGELWDAAGKLYLKENDNDERLKDKMDFLDHNPQRYPHQSQKFQRPNLGCRVIVQQNLCKLLSGITRELGDWLADIRVRTAQLLCVLVLNAEQDITQHIEKLLPAMYRACNDEDQRVVKNVELAAEYMGYFVLPSIYLPLILPTLDENLTAGHLQVFAAILRGSESFSLRPELKEIAEFLRYPNVCTSKKPRHQEQLLNCCSAITTVCQKDCVCIRDDLFMIIFTVIATCQENSGISETAEKLVKELAGFEGMSANELYVCCIHVILKNLLYHPAYWGTYDSKLRIFCACFTRTPGAIAQHPDLVHPILKDLNDTGNPEIRLKLFILLSEYFQPKEDDNLHLYKISQLGHPILTDIILPALVWTAGKTAEAIRTAAVCCLCALFDYGDKKSRKIPEDPKENEINIDDPKKNEKPTNAPKENNKKIDASKENEKNDNAQNKNEKNTDCPEENDKNTYDPIVDGVKKYSLQDFDKIMPILVTLVDDNAKKTRLYALRGIFLVLKVAKKLSFINEQQIHSTYPAVLKRLDDGCDDVRAAAAETLVEIWRDLPKNYDLVFSRSHVDYLYTTAIVHLDDPDPKFQALMLDSLLELAKIHPQLLATKIEKCSANFRNNAGLERLLNSCHALLRTSS